MVSTSGCSPADNMVMSCSTNILQLVDDILVDCMGGCESCLLMCDLSAAFDTVPHQVLLDKLSLPMDYSVSFFSELSL